MCLCTFPPSVYEIQALCILASLWYIHAFCFSCFHRFVVISYCSLIVISPRANNVENLFMCFFCHLYSSVVKYCLCLFPLYNWIVWVILLLSFFFLIFIYLFILAVLGLRFCAGAFSSCGKRGPLFVAVCGPLTVVASLVAEHRLQTRRISSCGSQAQLLRGMWDLPRPGLEPVFPALAGRFSTTAPPEKPLLSFKRFFYIL